MQSYLYTVLVWADDYLMSLDLLRYIPKYPILWGRGYNKTMSTHRENRLDFTNMISYFKKQEVNHSGQNSILILTPTDELNSGEGDYINLILIIKQAGQ